ncbi:MAG TPA: DUF3306 domain-containing protein, partial [Burkholderiaceae bacterium]|nr:DUF3306 domain-containing protein [Burkholderiaceae bacterium]
AQARQGLPLPEPAVPVATAPLPAPVPRPAEALPVQPVDTPTQAAATEARPAPPTLADVAALTRESDFSRFVAPGVDGEVRNAALKKLFADPRYNVMDGLDIYIDDYTKPDPLPRSMLRQMAQAAALGLLDDEKPAVEAAKPPAPIAGTPEPGVADAAAGATRETDEDAALRLQSHDAAGRGGAEDGAAGGRRQA